MAAPMTLMEFIKELLGWDSDSIQLRDWFQQDPHAALAAHGLGDLTPEDVHDAMVLVQDNDTVSFDRSYDTGSHGIDWNWENGGLAPAVQHGAPGHEFVTNNHVTNNIDDRDTIIDRSVNQNVDTHGGDFEQRIDDHSVNATGDGSVAAGGNISGSTITTGDGNVVGHGNHVVQGDDNTVAFGNGGSAVRGVNVDHGSGFSVNGPAAGNDSTTDSHNQNHYVDDHSTEIHDSGNVHSDSSVHTTADDHSHHAVGSFNDVDLHLG